MYIQIAMSERDRLKAELIKATIVAHITKTNPTGYTVREMVGEAIILFDKHLPESK